MTFQEMLSDNIRIYRNYHAEDQNQLKYPNETLVRFSSGYLRKHIPPGGRVLDYGYGAGNNSVFLIECGYEVHGVEIAEPTRQLVLDNLKCKGLDEKLLDRFTILDPKSDLLPYACDNFDLVVSNLVLYYYPSQKAIRRICRELWRCLKPGGLVFFTMLGTESSIRSDAQPSRLKNVYYVPGEGTRASLNGQYLYLIPDEETLKRLFSGFGTVTCGHVEEEWFGRRDFTWIYVGKKADSRKRQTP